LECFSDPVIIAAYRYFAILSMVLT